MKFVLELEDVLEDGGSAVDAAIATLLCNGVMNPQSMGIGGGCFMVIYDSKRKKTLTINGRETVPLTSPPQTLIHHVSNLSDPRNIGVPGEIAAYWKAHQIYGRLPWKQLFQPAIHLLTNGFQISKSLADGMTTVLDDGEDISKVPGLRDVFCDNMGNFLPEGSFTKWPKLDHTYRQIAEKGPDYIYKELAEPMAQEIQKSGGKLQKEDFEKYAAEVNTGIKFDLGDLTLVTHGAPSGGPIMGHILDILTDMDINTESLKDRTTEALTIHKMIEAIKFAYGKSCLLRFDESDEEIQKMKSNKYVENIREKIDLNKTHEISYYSDVTNVVRDYGTAHVSILSQDGDAVSVTSSINQYFGSRFVSESTGIIFNDSLYKDYDLTELKLLSTNCYLPGKRPLSSMAPAIFLDKKSGNVRMVIGSAGGTAAITTNIQVAVRNLWLGQDIEEAVRARRFHHQLDPNYLVYEVGFPQDILEMLKKFGHKMQRKDTRMSVVQAISKDKINCELTAFSDERKLPGKAIFVHKKT